ncbi:hypothetical protein HZS_3698 [Henneguya salminicola]|nr:hypothetical protein HZS_3698 [Henneguya salminicola]
MSSHVSLYTNIIQEAKERSLMPLREIYYCNATIFHTPNFQFNFEYNMFIPNFALFYYIYVAAKFFVEIIVILI